jgi:hypothetical protein
LEFIENNHNHTRGGWRGLAKRLNLCAGTFESRFANYAGDDYRGQLAYRWSAYDPGKH